MRIQEKVNRIYELFDEKRLTASEKRLRAVWNGQMPEDRLPFVFSFYPFESKMHGLPIFFAQYSPEETLTYYLDASIAHANIDDDYIPSVWAGLRQGTIATAFGCEEYFLEDQYYVKPIINSVNDIYNLKRPDVRRTGLTKFFIDRITRLYQLTDGAFPVHICDMQDPFSNAAKMWNDNDLMLACYDNPQAVHHLLDLITETTIDFARALIEATEGNLIPIHCMPEAWFPPGQGLALSVDYMALVSPDIFAEFIKPYVQRFAEAFGQVVLHSCGSFTPILDELKTLKGLKGINFGVSETALEDVANKLSPHVTLIPHATSVSCKNLRVLSRREHIENSISYLAKNRLPSQPLVYIDPEEFNQSRDDVLSPEDIEQLNQLALDVSRIGVNKATGKA